MILALDLGVKIAESNTKIQILIFCPTNQFYLHITYYLLCHSMNVHKYNEVVFIFLPVRHFGTHS